MTPALRPSVLLILAAAGLAAADRLGGPTQTLGASAPTYFHDSDGDLLPDRLEWALLLDPGQPDTDYDGVPDFLDAVQFKPPFGATAPAPPKDHETRVTGFFVDIAGEEWFALATLMRITVGGPDNVRDFRPHFKIQGVDYSLDRVFSSNLGYLRMVPTANEGLFVVACSVICQAKYLKFFEPCAVGATCVVGTRSFSTGAYLIDSAGATVSLMPFTPNSFALQPLDPGVGTVGGGSSQGTSSQGWGMEPNQVCEAQISEIGTGVGQVDDADCTGAPTNKCAPNCEALAGTVLRLDYGTSWANGGYQR